MKKDYLEEQITIGTKYPLKGLLTIPENGDGPYPAVVLVHGSGAHDMNEKIGKVYPFRDIAEGLAKRGIASIRYDKRTFSYGKELVKNSDYDSFTVKEETIEDAVFATELLKRDSRIDPERIFIAGHSLGGMLAPRIDAEGGDYAGLIILAGSPRKLEEIMIDQQNDYLEKSNAILKWLLKKNIKTIREKFNKLNDISDEEAKATPLFGKRNKLYYLKEMGEHHSVNYLKELKKPIFIMQGVGDLHVSIEKDFEKYREILGNHPQASFRLYPDLNHAFMPKLYDDIRKAKKEFDKAQKVEEYVIDDIGQFIKKSG